MASARELQTFDTLLIGMFNAMNTGFGDFEPGRHERLGPQPTFVRDFLCRFDAIFTLNQDTLLEQKYQRSDFLDGSRGRWFGSESPGLQQETVAGTPYAPPGVFRPHEPPFIVRDRYQPYFKLHGSSNWRVLNGSTLLILGQNKGADIDNIALLDWYRGQFREMLSQPGAHLMIIGYSFRDPHINEIIYQGTSKGAKLFIIHPEGVGILDKAPPLPGRTRALVEEFQECVIGASRRPFLSNFGSDTVELKKILRFFPQFP